MQPVVLQHHIVPRRVHLHYLEVLKFANAPRGGLCHAPVRRKAHEAPYANGEAARHGVQNTALDRATVDQALLKFPPDGTYSSTHSGLLPADEHVTFGGLFMLQVYLHNVTWAHPTCNSRYT